VFEREVLDMACSMMDVRDELHREIEKNGAVIDHRAMGPIAHPAIASVMECDKFIIQLFDRIGAPAEKSE
jgi:hypothetical protein